MKKTGIIIIILLFITSGALAVLYQRSISHIVTPPPGEEIVVPPTLPAIEKEQLEGLELSFVLDSRLDKKIILMTPANDVRDFCSVGSDGSLYFHFEDLLEEGEINAWPEIMFIWNNGEDQTVNITIKKEESLPPFIFLKAGFAGEPLQFDDHGTSVQSFQLEPGTRLPLGVGVNLKDNSDPEKSRHLKYTIIVE